MLSLPLNFRFHKYPLLPPLIFFFLVPATPLQSYERSNFTWIYTILSQPQKPRHTLSQLKISQLSSFSSSSSVPFTILKKTDTQYTYTYTPLTAMSIYLSISLFEPLSHAHKHTFTSNILLSILFLRFECMQCCPLLMKPNTHSQFQISQASSSLSLFPGSVFPPCMHKHQHSPLTGEYYWFLPASHFFSLESQCSYLAGLHFTHRTQHFAQPSSSSLIQLLLQFFFFCISFSYFILILLLISLFSLVWYFPFLHISVSYFLSCLAICFLFSYTYFRLTLLVA